MKTPSKNSRGPLLLAAAVLLALGSGGCRSARDCADRIPEELRADTLRYVLDRGLLAHHEMPRPDRTLAVGRGRPSAGLTRAEVDRLVRYAVGYEACIHGSTSR